MLYIQPEICRVVKESCEAHCHFRAGSTAFQQQLIERLSGNAQCRCQFRNGQTVSPHKPFPQYGSGIGGLLVRGYSGTYLGVWLFRRIVSRFHFQVSPINFWVPLEGFLEGRDLIICSEFNVSRDEFQRPPSVGSCIQVLSLLERLKSG